MLLNLRIDIPELGPSGVHHVVELQLHHAEILEAKESAHAVYEFFRSFFRGNAQVQRWNRDPRPQAQEFSRFDLCV